MGIHTARSRNSTSRYEFSSSLFEFDDQRLPLTPCRFSMCWWPFKSIESTRSVSEFNPLLRQTLKPNALWNGVRYRIPLSHLLPVRNDVFRGPTMTYSFCWRELRRLDGESGSKLKMHWEASWRALVTTNRYETSIQFCLVCLSINYPVELFSLGLYNSRDQTSGICLTYDWLTWKILITYF